MSKPRSFDNDDYESEDNLEFEIEDLQFDLELGGSLDYNEYHMIKSDLYCKHILEECNDEGDVYDIYDTLEKNDRIKL